MEFFRRNPSSSKKNVSSCLNEVLLSEEAFLSRLHEERMRSERAGSPLSLITIDYTKIVNGLVKKNGLSLQRITRHLAEALEKSTRATDIKGWCGNGSIGVLTPDTGKGGTHVIVEKLVKALETYPMLWASVSKKELTRCFCPSTFENDGNGITQTDESNKRANIHSTKQRKHFHLMSTYKQPVVFPQPAQQLAGAVAVAPWPFELEFFGMLNGRKTQLFVKRTMDIVGALVGITLFSPIMIIIAALIKLTSPGPIIFRQERLGLLGQPFIFMKFRSMRINCDATIHKDFVKKLIKGQTEEINTGTKDNPTYKIVCDPRMTPIGDLLRKTSLDELPQFFCVLKGDMSLVGPRPPIPYECNYYQSWHCRRILEAKPGITGHWQTSGRSTTTFDEMVRLDLQYARTWNLWLDIKILFKTFWAVFSGKGAY